VEAASATRRIVAPAIDNSRHCMDEAAIAAGVGHTRVHELPQVLQVVPSALVVSLD